MERKIWVWAKELAPAAALCVSCLFFFMMSFLSYGRIDKMASAMAGAAEPVIVIDPGHGGEDGGAQSASGTLEKDINLSVSQYLKALFESAGYTVVMTRDADVSIGDQSLSTIRERKVSDIHNRLKIVEEQGNCLLISVHQNHFTESKYDGTQVFYSTKTKGSEEIAERIRENVVSMLQPNNTRQCKPATDSIYLLWNTTKPSVLVECGFLSNAAEAEKLTQEVYQKQMAFAVYRGVTDYLCNPQE